MTVQISAADLATLAAGGTVGLQGPQPSPPPPPPPPTTKYGRYPGVYAMSVDGNNDPQGELNEITCLAAAIKANPQLDKIIVGYSMYRTWNVFQPTAKGVYDWSTIDTTAANLAKLLPGKALDIQLRPYNNWIAPFSANAGQSCLPAYIFNGGKTTYGNASQGGNGAGWGLVAYDGTSKYTMVTAALWNAAVMAEWNAAMIACAAHYASNPLVEGIKDFWPTEGCNFANGNPTAPTDYSGANLKANWISRCAALTSIKSALVHLMPGYLPSGWQMADLYPVVNAMAASGIGFSCTDVTNKSTGADLTYAQHMLLGQVDSTPNGPTNTWIPGGPVLLGGNSSSWPTAQPQDWQPGNNAAQVEAVLKIAYTTLQADHVSIAMASESDFNLKDFYSTSSGNGYIVNGLLAAGGIPS